MFVGIEPLLAFLLWVVPAGIWVARRIRERQHAARQHAAMVQQVPDAPREVIYAQLPFKQFSVQKVDIERVEVQAQADSDEANVDTHVALKMDSLLRRDAGHVLAAIKGFAWTSASALQAANEESKDAEYWMVCLN